MLLQRINLQPQVLLLNDTCMADKRMVAVHVTFSDEEWALMMKGYRQVAPVSPRSKAEVVRMLAMRAAADLAKRKPR